MAKSRPLGGNWRERRRPMTGPPGYASSVDYTTTPTPTPTPTPTRVLSYPELLSPQQAVELSAKYPFADVTESFWRDRAQAKTSEVAGSPETDRTYEVLKAQNRLLKIMQIAVYEEFIRVQDAIAEAKERAFGQEKNMKKGSADRQARFLKLMARLDSGVYDTSRVNRSTNAELNNIKQNAGVVSLERSDIGRLDDYINRLQAVLDSGGIGARKDARGRDIKVGFPKLVLTNMDNQTVDFKNAADQVIMSLWDPTKAEEVSQQGYNLIRKGRESQNNKLVAEGQRLVDIGESIRAFSRSSELDPSVRAHTMGWETLGEGDNPYITREALGDQHFYLKPNAIETQTNEFIGISKEGFGSDPTQEIKGQFASDENIESGDFEVGMRIDQLVETEPTLDEVGRWADVHPNLVTQKDIDAYKRATRPGIASPQDLIGTRKARFESEQFGIKNAIHRLISAVATSKMRGDDDLPQGITQVYTDPDTGQQEVHQVDSIAEINKAQILDVVTPVRIDPTALADSLQVLNSGFLDALRRQETRERVEGQQFGDRFVKVKRTTHKPTYDPLVVNKVLFDASPEDGKRWLSALRDLVGANKDDLNAAYKKLGWDKKGASQNKKVLQVIRTKIYEQKPKKVQRKDETPATLAARQRAEEEKAAQKADSKRRYDLARSVGYGPGGLLSPLGMGVTQAEADRSIDHLAQPLTNYETREVLDNLPVEETYSDKFGWMNELDADLGPEQGAVIGPGEAERQQARRDLQLEQYDIDRIATSGWVDALQRPNVRQQMTDLSVQSGFGSDLNTLSVDQRKQLIRRFDVGYEGLQSVISSGNPQLLKPAHSRGFTQPGKDTGGFVHPDNAKGIVGDSMTVFGGSSLSPEQIRRFKEEVPQGDRKRLGINSSPDSIQAYFNAVNADATLILGTKTTLYGNDATTFTDEAKVADEFGGNVKHNPSPQEFADWLKQSQIRVLNVVGSTQSPYAGPNELQRQLQTLLAEADRNRILNPASGDTLADHAQFWIDLGPNAGVEQLPVQYTGPTRPIKAMGKDGGSNHVLSNLWQIDMDYDPLAGGGLRVEVPTPRGMQMTTFPSVEHAYQALKGGGTVTLEQIAPFQTLQQVPKNFASWSPEKQRSWQGQQARRMGGKDVDKSTNLQLMESLLRARFEQDPEFREALLTTDGSRLTHPVKDKFWAENYPALLMGIRDGELGGGRRTLDRDLSHFQARTMRSIQAEGLDPKTASSINRRLDKGETVTYGREVGQPGEILSIEGLKTPVKIIGSKDGRTRIKAATPAEIREYGNAVNTLFPDAYPEMLTQQQRQDKRAQAFIGDAEVLEDVRITPSPDNIRAPFALPFSPAISPRMFEARPLGSERPVQTRSVRNDIPVDTQGRRGLGYVEVETVGGDVQQLGQPLPSYQEGVQISNLTGPPPRNLPPELYDLHSQYVQTHGRIVADQALSYAYDQRGFGNYNSAEAFRDFINSRAGKRSAIPVDDQPLAAPPQATTDKPVQTVPEPNVQGPPVGANLLGPQVGDNLPVDQIDAGNAQLASIYADEEADRPYDPTPQNIKGPPGNNPSTPAGSQKSDPTQDVVPQPVQGIQPGLLKDWDYDAMPADDPKVAPSTLERADKVRNRNMKQAGLDPTKTVDQNAWKKVQQTGTYKFVNSAGKVFTFPAKASWWASKKTITGAIALSKNNPSIAGVTIPDLVEFAPIGIQKYEDAVRPKHKGRDLYLHQLPEHQRSFENISAYLFNNNFIGQEAKSYLDELSNNIKSDVARGLIASPKEHPDFEELRSALNEYAVEPTAHKGRMFTINEQVDEDDLNQFELNLANLQGRSLGGQTNNVLSANAHRGGNVYDIWGWSDLTHQRQSWDDFADGLMSSAELMAQARGLRVARGFVGKGAANLAARAGALKWAGRIGGRAIGWPMVAAEAAIYAEGAADDLASYFHPDYGIPGLREATGVDPITVSHMYTTFQQRPDAKEKYLEFSRQNPVTDENYSVHHNMLLNGIPYSNFHVWEYRDEIDGVKLPQDQIHVVNTWTQETVPISEVERRIPNYGSKWKAEVSRDSIIQGLKLAESVNKERAELGLSPDGRVIISDDMIAEQRQILSEMRDGFTQEELQGFDSLNPIPNVAGFGPIRESLDTARGMRNEFELDTGIDWLNEGISWGLEKFGQAEDIPRKYLADEELAKRMNNQITLGKGHVDGKGNKIPSASWEESSGRNLATDLWGSAKGTAQLFGAPVEFDKDKYRIIHRDIARDPKSAYDIQQMRNKFNYSPQVQALDKWQEPELMAPPSPDEQMKKKNRRKNTLSNPFDTGLLGPQDWMNQ